MKAKGVLGGLVALGLLLTAAAGVSGAHEITPGRSWQAMGNSAAMGQSLGSSFTYQGRLTDGGDPVNRLCNFTFKLYDTAGTGSPPSGGTLVGMETKKGVEVAQGLFTVHLDFTEGAFNGQARWLEIAVDCGTGPITLSPRQALTAAPYAIYALSAPWSGLAGIPTGLADGDDDTLSSLDCNHGQIAKWDEDSQSWECSRDKIDDGSGEYWSLTGNAGTTPGTNFLGTTDSVGLNLTVSDTVALRLEPTSGTPNLIGGYRGNSVTPGVAVATIGGGGKTAAINRVVDEGGTVGGGAKNIAGEEDGDIALSIYATVGGGWNNKAGGWGATVGGGGDNTANGGNATVSGGNGNTASEGAASVGGGEGNVASGLAATVCGGWYSRASGRYAAVPGGASAVASHYGELAYASGQFRNQGDAQTSTYVLRVATADDTPTALFLDGSAEQLTIANGRTVSFDVLVAARSDGGASAGYQVQGLIEHAGSTTAFVGTPTVAALGEDDSTWDATVEADSTNHVLVVKVTGAKDTSIRWVATVRTAEVAWPVP